MVRETVDRIRTSLKSGQYTNEASISQGVVLPVLQALNWPIFETSVVKPEHSVKPGNVDFALCDTRKRPKILLEVKRIGRADTGDRQLFEYVFHEGVPMAVLTDGQEWSFFLPGEEGPYEERRVYKLDLLERSPAESTERLYRYLEYQRVVSGEALATARDDYKDVTRGRHIAAAIPKAWHQLLSGPDELLVDLLADKVEDICGYKPDLDDCSRFIQKRGGSQPTPNVATFLDPEKTDVAEPQMAPPRRPPPEKRGFSFLDIFHPANSAKDVIRKILIAFAQNDPEFLERFAARKHGRKRRWIARSKSELYPGRPDLEIYSVELVQGWWMGTNYSIARIGKMVELACEVANVEFGKDLTVSL